MNNSEILFLYDAKFTNPNGDPDEENRPRMDYDREINLVSDLRLKRYIRDYLFDNGHDIFVRKVDDKSVTPKARVDELKNFTEEEIFNAWVDVRLFGATMPVKNENKSFIGPVQFNWGYSLNKVELLEASITSHFSAGEQKGQGTIGKDFRVKYSFIAFFGVISGKRAEHTRLSESDIKLLDEAMKYAIPLQATRSKIGQYPRLYMRVEYKDDRSIIGDFRKHLKLVEKNPSIRDIDELYIEIGNLINEFKANKNKIYKIAYFMDKNLDIRVAGEKVDICKALEGFNLIEVG
ncbi:MAG: type I-B CRISPR-associated protein Cas7/Csh2 [Firmicutes bacterium]|nr:type I-B CRISPR-associated protein Cas7/Csh2 [Bacillota bacterium]